VAQIQVRHLRSEILAMSVATMLALYTIGITIPALTPVSAYATNYDDKNNKHPEDKNNKHPEDKNNKHPEDKNNKHPEDTNSYESAFLSDLMGAYFNNDN
jgi:hypothetical protein